MSKHNWVLWKTTDTEMLARGYRSGILEREPSWKAKVRREGGKWRVYVDKRAPKRNPPILAVPGRGWIQESYETGDPKIRQRVLALKKLGYRAKAFGMGSQVTQWGLVKLTMVDIRPGTSGDEYLERVPQANPHKRAVSIKFPTKASAVAYARSVGAKRFSISKLRKGR